MTDQPDVRAKWISGRRVLITATRGAVTTEARLTEAEAGQLWRELDRLLHEQNEVSTANCDDRP